MSEDRRSYKKHITLNNRSFTRVIIDPHYEQKHSDMSDRLILELVSEFDGKEIDPDSAPKEGFEFFRYEITYKGKIYRLILTYGKEDFIGVVNAFRVKEKRT